MLSFMPCFLYWTLCFEIQAYCYLNPTAHFQRHTVSPCGIMDHLLVIPFTVDGPALLPVLHFQTRPSNRHSHTLVVKVNLTTLGNGLASSIKVEHTTPCYPEIFLQVHTQEKCMPLFTKIKVQGGFLAAFFLFYFYFKHGNYYTCHVSLR